MQMTLGWRGLMTQTIYNTLYSERSHFWVMKRSSPGCKSIFVTLNSILAAACFVFLRYGSDGAVPQFLLHVLIFSKGGKSRPGWARQDCCIMDNESLHPASTVRDKEKVEWVAWKISVIYGSDLWSNCTFTTFQHVTSAELQSPSEALREQRQVGQTMPIVNFWTTVFCVRLQRHMNHRTAGEEFLAAHRTYQNYVSNASVFSFSILVQVFKRKNSASGPFNSKNRVLNLHFST